MPSKKKDSWTIDREKREAAAKAYDAEVIDVEKRLRALADKTVPGGAYVKVSTDRDSEHLNNAMHALRKVRNTRRGR
jgi:6-phosphogluconolactonase (cycloisomerase 2 family)